MTNLQVYTEVFTPSASVAAAAAEPANQFAPLPNAAESEKLVLGAILLEPARFADINRELIAPDFYNYFHSQVFAALETLHRRGEKVDVVLLQQEIKASGATGAPPSVSDLVGLTYGLPHNFDVAPHIAKIKRTYLERRRLRFLADAQRLTANPSEENQAALAHVFKQLNQLNEQLTAKTYAEYSNLFVAQTAQSWLEKAKERPIARMLFGEFWYEGELCILFSDTNMGKSILAVQLADSLSRGQEQGYFKLQVGGQKVLYLDFELSDKQFEARYSAGAEAGASYHTDHYDFHPNFLRAELSPDSDVPSGFRTFEEYLGFSLEQLIVETNIKVLIVDNLTYLRGATEKAQDALPLMKQLKALKNKYNLSILVLAHTPKRDLSKPITRNDLQGSKMLINFCDSAFAIGESQRDSGFRYLKQIKARNTGFVYDADNVALCQINKAHNFLKFEFLDFCRESEHLQVHRETERTALVSQVKELTEAGKSQREIAFELKISKASVLRYQRG